MLSGHITNSFHQTQQKIHRQLIQTGVTLTMNGSLVMTKHNPFKGLQPLSRRTLNLGKLHPISSPFPSTIRIEHARTLLQACNNLVLFNLIHPRSKTMQCTRSLPIQHSWVTIRPNRMAPLRPTWRPQGWSPRWRSWPKTRSNTCPKLIPNSRRVRPKVGPIPILCRSHRGNQRCQGWLLKPQPQT